MRLRASRRVASPLSLPYNSPIGQDRLLPRQHPRTVFGRGVVPAEQVEDAMDDEEAHLARRVAAPVAALRRRALAGDVDLAELAERPFAGEDELLVIRARVVEREGDHVGRLVV